MKVLVLVDGLGEERGLSIRQYQRYQKESRAMTSFASFACPFCLCRRSPYPLSEAQSLPLAAQFFSARGSSILCRPDLLIVPAFSGAANHFVGSWVFSRIDD